MTSLGEDGKTVELREGDLLIAAKVDGDVYGQAIPVQLDDFEATESTANVVIENLMQRIEGEI